MRRLPSVIGCSLCGCGFGGRVVRAAGRVQLARDRSPDSGAPARGAGDREAAAERTDAIHQAVQPASVPGIGGADPVVVDLELEARRVSVETDHGPAGIGVLGDIGQRLGNDEVDGGLDVLGKTTRPALDADRNRRPLGQGADRGIEPVVSQHGWIDAAGELP